jgi:hypothetical protein
MEVCLGRLRIDQIGEEFVQEWHEHDTTIMHSYDSIIKERTVQYVLFGDPLMYSLASLCRVLQVYNSVYYLVIILLIS